MNTFLEVIAYLDTIFTVSALFELTVVVVFAMLVLVVRDIVRKPTITHYMRTDMVDMVLSAKEYNVFLKAGDIRGEWKPVINGKLLPLDAGVLEAHIVAQAELAAKDADYEEMCAAYAEEAEAHYAQEALDNEVVECSGACLCNNLYVFTTTNKLSADVDYCTMIACNHCPVCNPEGLVDVVEYTAPALTVVSEVQEGERVTFTFNDGSTAIMRAYTYNGCTERQLDAPSEGGYRVDSIQQARAIDAFTGTDCIPF